ncbi:MAG: type II secretion system protein GspM [Chthonomonadales bacterium]
MREFWSRRNPRERVLIALCILAVIVGVPAMLQPPGAGAGKLIPASEARRKYNAALKQKLALEDDTKALDARLKAITYSEAPPTLTPKLVQQLQEQARTCGIHLREIKPLRVHTEASVTKVPISVRFTAPFAQAIPYIYRIEDPKGRLVAEKATVVTPDPKAKVVDVELQVACYTTALPPTVERKPAP